MITCFQMSAKYQTTLTRLRNHPVLRVCASAVGLALVSCGSEKLPEMSTSETVCSGQTAQIQVMDGLFKRLCGCSESSDTLINSVAGETLTCTVSSGTIIHFHFETTHVQHQIVPSGLAEIPATPLTQREGLLVVPAHAVQFNSVGTYPFQDRYNSLMQGKIIVN